MSQKPIASHEAPAARRHRWYFYAGIVLLTAAVLFVAFLGFLTVTEYRPAPVETAMAGAVPECAMPQKEELRILTFNTGYASLGEESDFLMDGGRSNGTQEQPVVEKNLEGIRQILEREDADICMLQEVDLRSARSFDQNQMEFYSEALPGHQWYYAPNFRCRFVPYPIPPMGRIDSGVATYSRFAVEEASRISLPNPFSWPVRTANLKRCMLVTRIPMEGAELVVINFHLEAYDDGAGKEAQTRQLLDLMEEEYSRGNYVIAGGDFNQIFPGVHTDLKPTSAWVPGNLDPLPAEMEGWNYVYDDSVPTCRLLNQPYAPEDPLTQYYVIDGFIVSPNLEVLELETLDEGFRYSDHNPVVMEVSLG